MYSWSLSQAFGMDSIPVCWKLDILLRRAFVLPNGKNLARNAMEHWSHVLTAFLVLIKPLFCLPQKGERKQKEPDDVRRNSQYGYGLAELQKVLETGIGILIRLATEWASLHHVYEAGLQLKVDVLGPVATLAAKGTEKSWSVFSAMGSVVVVVLEELVRLSTARAEEGRHEVGPFSRASQDFQRSLSARRNQTNTTLFSSKQEKTKR